MYKAIPQDRQQDGDRVALPPIFAQMLPGIAAAGIQQTAGASRIATQWLSFVYHRLGEDVRLAEQLVTAKSPAEAWGRYADFWQKAAQDYRDEYAALAKLSGEIMHAGVETSHQCGAETSESAAAPVAKAA